MIHPRLPWAQYCEAPYLNFSRLKLFEKSPVHFRAYVSEDTSTRMRNRALHCMVLEPQNFDAGFAVWKGDRRAKGYKEFEAESAGLTIITSAEYDTARFMAHSARKRCADLLSEGMGEVSITTTLKHRLPGPDGFRESGEEVPIPVKARIDWLNPSRGICDLKAIGVTPREVERIVTRLMTRQQLAWYVDTIRADTGNQGETLPAYVLAVEDKAPFDCVPYRLTEAALAWGRKQYRPWLDKYVECQRADRWPGVGGDSELMLDAPAWGDGGENE